MEGKFVGEGLQTLDEDDDMLTAMAKELVEKNGIGEGADVSGSGSTLSTRGYFHLEQRNHPALRDLIAQKLSILMPHLIL
jgi:hypothetical protein